MHTLTSTPTRIPTVLAPPLAAIQFLTRIPVPPYPFDTRTLPRAAAFFPLVGTALALLAALTSHVLTPHLPRTVVAIAVVTLLVLLTGALHEDALADCADAFGLSRTRERTLAILHDSAIGSFGAAALTLVLLARVTLLATLPLDRVTPTLLAALTLSRWSVLPLSLLPSATPASGRGSTIARQLSPVTLAFGTIFTATVLLFVLHTAVLIPTLAACLVIALTAAFYHHRLGGTTGDCFGVTIQLVELTVLLCGAWHA